MYIITLSDGSTIEANLNCNTWESSTEITDEMLKGKTDSVSIKDEDGNIEELGECTYMIGIHDGDKYLFFLDPLTDEEKRQKELLKALNDINDQITEIQEVLVEV